MAYKFHELAFTPSVRKTQTHYYSKSQGVEGAPERDVLTEGQRIVERLFLIEVVSFDWNCPQYITPRYTAPEVEDAVAPLKQRIAELEAELENAG